MHLLTIESTCDETAAAILNENLEVLSAVVASQAELHQQFKGVVPEIAARAHLERILPVLDETIRKAELQLDQIDAIAVANTPGLAGSILVGLMAAKTLAWSLDVPLIAVNHLHGHIYACKIASGNEIFPCLGLIVSGGHSNLYLCHSAFEFEPIGGTIDDAAGEAFDKVASMLGLPYPGGPSVSRCAEQGDPAAINFPRPFLKEKDRLDFSFSGLKTAVRYEISGPEKPTFENSNLTEKRKADIAAGFQQAVIDCLVGKTELAIQKTKMQRLCVGGGVAANKKLREALTEMAERNQIELIIAPFHLCTDNAVMAGIAIEKLKAGQFEEYDLEAMPGLVRVARS